MWILLLFFLAVLFFLFPTFRCVVCHPFKCIVNGLRDFVLYFLHKGYNDCQTGELVAFVGLFGKGKTLSAVHHVCKLYRRYNNKPVWDRERKKFVTQRVKVISNVALSIPYEDFQSLAQIVRCAKVNADIDKENDTRTIVIVLGDEFSVQLNSRNFKSNIDPLFLNTLLTCRHYYISIYYTSQRFGHVDALLRQVTSSVIDCNKLWRLQRQSVYDAWDMENATNVLALTPRSRSCWFVTNQDYNAYNTLACVGNLEKSVKDGDMLTEDEILALQRNDSSGDMNAVVKPSRRWRRNHKR